MELSSVLELDAGGRRIPIARTGCREVAELVARSAVDDLKAARTSESESVVRTLLDQELERLEHALQLLAVLGPQRGPSDRQPATARNQKGGGKM